eukprot:13178959-Alexandrium_andersonii.AAC.1
MRLRSEVRDQRMGKPGGRAGWVRDSRMQALVVWFCSLVDLRHSQMYAFVLGRSRVSARAPRDIFADAC